MPEESVRKKRVVVSSTRTPKKRTTASSRTSRTSTTAPKKAVAKKVSTKRVTKKKKLESIEEEEIFEEVEENEEEVGAAPKRKAPTPLASTNASFAKSRRSALIGVVTFSLVLIVSAVIGLSDTGVVNVQSRIAERMASASPEERVRLEGQQRAQAAAQVPDGGLVPSGVSENQAESVVASSTDVTASSTDATASSTDSMNASSTTSLVSEPEETVAGASSSIPTLE